MRYAYGTLEAKVPARDIQVRDHGTLWEDASPYARSKTGSHSIASVHRVGHAFDDLAWKARYIQCFEPRRADSDQGVGAPEVVAGEGEMLEFNFCVTSPKCFGDDLQILTLDTGPNELKSGKGGALPQPARKIIDRAVPTTQAASCERQTGQPASEAWLFDLPDEVFGSEGFALEVDATADGVGHVLCEGTGGGGGRGRRTGRIRVEKAAHRRFRSDGE